MRILLLGKDGQVGWQLQRTLASLGQLQAIGRQELDLTDLVSLRELLVKYQPNVIVNAAAYTAVDKAEVETELASSINCEAVKVLAEEAKRLNAWLVHYSTDYVFDGTKEFAYTEDDITAPLSVYGKTKYAGEQHIRELHNKHFIFRTSWVYAARGHNFAKTILKLATDREGLSIVSDQYGAPTSAELIADITSLALYKAFHHPKGLELTGTYHLTASGYTSWHGFAQYVLELAQYHGLELKTNASELKKITTEDYPLPAPRPKNSKLNTTKLSDTFDVCLPEWQYHVKRLMDELAAQEVL